MAIARYSRHHRSGRQADDIVDRLRDILRTLIGVASGRRPHRRVKRRHSGHGPTASRSLERRETAGRWLVKREISAWRLGIVICVLVVFAWIGWRIVAQTAALSLAESHPEQALDFVADRDVALNRLVEQELAEPDGNLDSAREWAQRVLRASPLNARALTLLGLIAERKGDQKNAEALMRIAAARTWRDETTEEWLLNREAQRGDYDLALPYADAILRTSWPFPAELFPVLASFTVNPRAFEALTAFLATAPPWRSWFLSELSTRLANQTRLVQLYAALNDSENPPTKEELRPYLNRLINNENFELAYRTWHATLPPQQRAIETHPFNRDFAFPVDNLPFNWNMGEIGGADIQVVSSANDDKKRALLVEFLGRRIGWQKIVKQLMMLPAGDYSLSGRVKAADLRTSRGLWWRISCANAPVNTLANTELVSGTMPWTDFAVKFKVPATDCGALWLELELPARIEPELRIEGQVWYQDLRVTPAPTPSAAAPPH